MKKTCSRCKLSKKAAEFWPNKAMSDGLHSYCRECFLEYRREYDLRRDLNRYYGISMEDYQALFNEQGGACAVCGKSETATLSKSGRTKRLSVDHDHKTDRVRGLLCGRCNTAIGLMKDDPELLLAAAAYVTPAFLN